MFCFEILDALGGRRTTSPLKLPRPWLHLDMMLHLDAEVRNGVFHQLFWNSEGAYNELQAFRIFFGGQRPVLPSTKLSRLSGGERIRGKSLPPVTGLFRGSRLTKRITRHHPRFSSVWPSICVSIPMNFDAGPNYYR
jgi:hypothetical protein